MNSLHLCVPLLLPLQLAFCQERLGQFTGQSNVGQSNMQDPLNTTHPNRPTVSAVPEQITGLTRTPL